MAEPHILETWDIPTGVPAGGPDPVLTGVAAAGPAPASIRVEARAGEVITVVGSNGAGKSALATWMASVTHQTEIRRVLAQRRLWFEFAGPSISPADREGIRQSVTAWDRDLSSRYVDRGDQQRSGIALFDLLGKLSKENQKAVALFYSGATPEMVTATMGDQLLTTLNSVLEKAGLHTEVDVTEEQTFSATHRALRATYPISQMSDGERSALLLAAEVLTAPEGAIVVVDEPERHLHRAISAGLIEALLDVRADCAFVVLTHDLDLATRLSSRPGRTFASAGVHWVNNQATSWDLHEVKADDALPESARRAILGGRERILFIEGEQASIDLALYEHLFPGWSLVPSGGCEQVTRAVSGLRASTPHHWVEAHGLVDGDGRTPDERASLESRGVHPLHVSEVENLYYVIDVVRAVAVKQAGTLGGDVEDLISKVKVAVLSELGDSATTNRLATKLAKDALARKLLAHMPDAVDDGDVTITIPSPLPRIRTELQTLHTNSDYDGLVSAVPIRDTKVRSDVAAILDFKNFRDYQKAALKCIGESNELASKLARATGVPI